MSAGFLAGTATVVINANTKPLFGALNGLQGKLSQVGASLTALGVAFAGIGASILGPFAKAVQIGSEFERELSVVKAVTGATEDEFKSLTETARELGRTTTFTAKEAAEGLKFLSKAGFTAKEALAGIGDVLDLARAGDVTTGRAAEIAADIKGAFGLAATDIKRIADNLSFIANRTNTDVEKLGRSFKFLSATGKLTGQSFEEISLSLGILANSGIKASLGGTTLNRVLTQIGRSKGRKKIEDLGVAVTGLGGKIRPVSRILEDLFLSLEDLGEAERFAKLEDIFGIRGLRAGGVVGKNLIDNEALREQQQNINGFASDTRKTIEDNLIGTFKLLQSAVADLAIEIQRALAPVLTDIIKKATEWVRVSIQWAKENPGLVKGLAAIGFALAGIGGALVGAGGLAFLVSSIATAAPIIAGVGATLAAAAGPIALVAIAVGAVTAAIVGLASEQAAADKEILDGVDAYIKKLKEENEAVEKAKRAQIEMEKKAAEEKERIRRQEAIIRRKKEKEVLKDVFGLEEKFRKNIESLQEKRAQRKEQQVFQEELQADPEGVAGRTAAEAEAAELRMLKTRMDAEKALLDTMVNASNENLDAAKKTTEEAEKAAEAYETAQKRAKMAADAAERARIQNAKKRESLVKKISKLEEDRQKRIDALKETNVFSAGMALERGGFVREPKDSVGDKQLQEIEESNKLLKRIERNTKTNVAVAGA